MTQIEKLDTRFMYDEHVPLEDFIEVVCKLNEIIDYINAHDTE